MKAVALVVVLSLLAACAPPAIPLLSPAAPAELPAPVAQSPAEPAVRALFAQRPALFFAAAETACAAPGQRPVSDGHHSFRCESLPEPDAAASLILAYDGDILALPRYVVRFSGAESPEGYLMRAESFIEVPQRTGGHVEIRPDDPVVAASFADLLTRAGGRVLP